MSVECGAIQILIAQKRDSLNLVDQEIRVQCYTEERYYSSLQCGLVVEPTDPPAQCIQWAHSAGGKRPGRGAIPP